MDTLVLPAPAKVNLFLHVTGRRADGYHRIETVFQLLDQGDEVAITVTREPGVRRAGTVPGVTEEADLTLRAARALAAHAGVAAGAAIALRKRLPLGGGLGGGSSDAATVLVGLNRLWGLDLGTDVLAALGLALGADVPVFVHGHSAFARGVGEELHPVLLAPTWYLVVTPAVAVSTETVFGSDSLTRDTAPLKMRSFPWGLGSQAGVDRLWARTRNDCEPVVRAARPEVAAALDWLSGHGPARMTGTGASVFARFRDRLVAERALAQAPPGVTAFVARGVDRSPLLDAVAAGRD